MKTSLPSFLAYLDHPLLIVRLWTLYQELCEQLTLTYVFFLRQAPGWLRQLSICLNNLGSWSKGPGIKGPMGESGSLCSEELASPPPLPQLVRPHCLSVSLSRLVKQIKSLQKLFSFYAGLLPICYIFWPSCILPVVSQIFNCLLNKTQPWTRSCANQVKTFFSLTKDWRENRHSWEDTIGWRV